MAAGLTQLVHHLRRLVLPPELDSDAVLLERFVQSGDEPAFAALVARHGPMVLRVCQRVLADRASAEDCFQATFLVFAQKARSLRRPASLVGWLHGVALRVASKARRAGYRRRLLQLPANASELRDLHPDPLEQLTARELLVAVDEEVQRLPEVYRLPVILCCVENLSQEETARRLGWTAGSVKARLERGRKCLELRLAKRGLMVSATLAVVAVSRSAALAVGPGLRAATAKAAMLFVTGSGAKGISATAALLAKETLQGMAAWNLKALAVITLILAATIGGVGTLAQRGVTKKPLNVSQGVLNRFPQDTGEAPTKQAAPSDVDGDPLPTNASARLGTTRFRHGGLITTLAYSPDGKILASGAWDWSARLWDATTGRPLHVLRSAVNAAGNSKSHEGWVLSVAFAPDGKTLATAADHRDQTIRLWDVQTGKALLQIKGHEGAVHAVAFSPNGKILASAGADGTIRFWEPRTGLEIRQLRGHGGNVTSLCFSPGSKLLASGGVDQTARVWDVETGQEVRQLPAPGGAVSAVTFSRDGKMVAIAGTARAIILADAGTGQQLRRLDGFTGQSFAIAFAPGGKTLAASCGSSGGREGVSFGTGEVWTWDVATGKPLGTPRAKLSQMRAIAFSPDGKVLAGGGEDRFISRWDVDGAKYYPTLAGHQSWVSALTFLPDSKSLASSGYDRTVRLWNLKNSKDVRSFTTGNAAALTLVVTADGKRLASGAEDGELRLWDLRTGNLLRSFTGHKGGVNQIAFSADETRLISAGQDATVRLWEVATGKELRRFIGHEGAVLTVAWAPDGRQLASGGDDRIVRLWDIDTGKQRQLAGHKAHITQVAFLPNGQGLVSASAHDSRAILWEVATGKPRREFDVPMNQFAHKTLALSPDGRLVAITRDDARMIKIWNVLTGELAGEFRRHDGWIRTLAFSPDGMRLASGSEDTTILVWDLERLKLPSTIHGDLTAAKLEALWLELASAEPAKAYSSVSLLAHVPRQSVPLIRKHLKPVAAVAEQYIVQLTKGLDSESFSLREKATRELGKLGTLAEPALKKLLASSPTLEAQRRAMGLLDKNLTSPERLQALRAVETLGYIGTEEAERLLQELAGGTPEGELTRQATMAAEQLAKRKAIRR